MTAFNLTNKNVHTYDELVAKSVTDLADALDDIDAGDMNVDVTDELIESNAFDVIFYAEAWQIVAAYADGNDFDELLASYCIDGVTNANVCNIADCICESIATDVLYDVTPGSVDLYAASADDVNAVSRAVKETYRWAWQY